MILIKQEIQIMKPEYLQFTSDVLGSLERGIVSEIHETGEVSIEVKVGEHRLILCDFLETSDQPRVSLQVGDLVLFLLPRTSEEKGCVLGRIGRYREPEKEIKKKAPENLVVEAKKQLDLKCGQSSIVMRRDGKLVLKGVDVVSRAKRNNKIKGGSVNIN
jgi:hypothetical protein